MNVRVRIAPSPTGYLHVGNARAALFNWLFARHHGGTFIVRIDDTDLERSSPEYETDVLEGLRWLGLEWDEGVGVGGSHGSYRQSDRFDRYRQVAQDLVASGAAYHDERSAEELDELRTRAQRQGRHPGYYIRRPETDVTSGPIRLSVPQDAAVEFVDLVRGDMRFEPESIDDFVILRSDGTPTYHLASTVDDVDYAISHVVRGEDLLPSTPKHILLTQALGEQPPTYAHLPLLFGPDGKKLSKRHGDTSLRAYREGGYLPEAVVNFMALLGWSLDAERTVFTVQEAVEAFEVSKVSKNPAVFDTDKLLWMNGEYIRALSAGEFARRARPYVEGGLGKALEPGEWEVFAAIGPLVQERTKLLTEVADQVRFLYAPDLSYDEKSWEKVMTKEGVVAILTEARTRLADLDTFDHTSIEATLRGMLEVLGVAAGKGLQPVRVAVTGSSVSPPLFESVAALGRERTVQRLDRALEKVAG